VSAEVRMFKGMLLVFSICLLSVFAVSCNRSDTISEIEQREAAVPAMQQAWELQMPSQSDFSTMSEGERVKLAYLLYRHTTFFNPTNGLAHYELGLLLKERLNQPAMAICAFEAYRFLRPMADKARKAERLIQEALPAAKELEIRSVYGHYVHTQRIDELAIERKKLLLRLDELTNLLIASQNALEAATNELVLARAVAPLPEPTPVSAGDGLKPSSDLSIPGATDSETLIPKGSPKGIENSVGVEQDIMATHIVGVGDSLWKLAVKYYDDPNALGLIYEANKDKLRSPNTLPKGMSLIIPARKQFEVWKPVAASSRKLDYQVPPDTTLSEIATKICGFSEAWERIYNANKAELERAGISDAHQMLPVNFRLVIPDLPALPRIKEEQERLR